VPPELPFLPAADRDLLTARIEQAVRLARRNGRPVVASITVPVPGPIDPAAAAFASRRAADRWFCFEQPDRDRFAIAGWGQAATVQAHGKGRFTEIAGSCRELARDAIAGDLGALPGGAGPVFTGGFAFADGGGLSAEWSALAPADFVLPEIALLRRGDQTWLTAAAAAQGDEDSSLLLNRLVTRFFELRVDSLPLLDPHPARPPRVASAAPPEHFEGAVARAVELIARGDLTKIVLAREVRVHAAEAIDPGAVFGALREVFPSCFCFCVGTADGAFVGASPELLVRRDGARAQTVALAGTTRRSADPAVDAHLGEQLLQSAKNQEEHGIVARRIEKALGPVSLWVSVADEPVLVKVHNVQHLATPIRAQLADPVPAVELAGRLHPTPAVGGEPWDAARPLIPALEGLDRGWYAGPVGWTDLAEDGEFCVGIRCALLRGPVAHLYAGNGIVRDSDPAAELAETEAKLQALLPLVS
jgi:salicylate biosynthesis isochorismate synthase/menaquinone-specific isochorismate synthase